MPLIPNFLERLIFRLNLFPSPSLDVAQGAGLRVVGLALKMGIFESIARNKSLSTPELARMLHADERGLTFLLGVLEAFGYLRKKKGRYENTSITSKWVLQDSPDSQGNFLYYWAHVTYRFWDIYQDEAVRNGRPSTTFWEWLSHEPEASRTAQMAFMTLARPIVDEVVAKVPVLDNARRLLDVGGMHGLYSIRFCQKYPNLTSTILDLPWALDVARENIAAEKISDKVSVQPGDYFTDDIGGDYDVALVFFIVHDHLPERNIELLHRIASALNPGGQVVILEGLKRKIPGRFVTAVNRFLDMTYFVTMGGQAYSFEELSDWLAKAGFSEPNRIRLSLKSAGFSLVVAAKSNK